MHACVFHFYFSLHHFAGDLRPKRKDDRKFIREAVFNLMQSINNEEKSTTMKNEWEKLDFSGHEMAGEKNRKICELIVYDANESIRSNRRK